MLDSERSEPAPGVSSAVLVTDPEDHRGTPASDASAATPKSPPPPSNNSPQTRKATLARRFVTGLLLPLMLYYYFSGALNSLFQYHPMAMSVAFVVVMPEVIHAAHCVRRSRSMADRAARITTHMYLSLGVKTLALVGFIVIYTNKGNRGKPHLTTWHGRLGASTVVALAAQVVLGLAVHWRLVSNVSFARKAHKWLGVTVALAGSTTFLLGMLSNWAAANVANPFINGTFSFSVFVLCAWAYFKE